MFGPQWERQCRESDQADRQMARNAVPFIVAGVVLMLLVGYALR